MEQSVKNKAELEAEFARAGDKLVLVDFFATWCKPCAKIGPALEQIAAQHSDRLVLLRVDVDQVEGLVGEYGIEVMPTFVLRRSGRLLATLVGGNECKLRELLAEHLAEPRGAGEPLSRCTGFS